MVVPPSINPETGGTYSWLRGNLQDIPSLPTAKEATPAKQPAQEGTVAPLRAIKKGRRNTSLFKVLLREVRNCDSLEALWEVALAINTDCDPPLTETELRGTVESVWTYETTGENWAGKEAKIRFTLSEYNILMENPDALALRGILQMMHSAREEPFGLVAKSMADSNVIPRWGWRRYRSAIKWLVGRGFLNVVHEGGKKPGDKWEFILSSPLAHKGTSCGPNIIKHPSALSLHPIKRGRKF